METVAKFGGRGAGSGSSFGLPPDVIDKQRNGTVGVYNTLREHGVALLADEVGMGKTYQALGVISLVFAQNPGARVLVIAPNQSVQVGWRRAYSDFIDTKVVNSALRDPLLGTATHPRHYCSDIIDFATHYMDNPRGLFLTRVSSFSSLRTSLSRGSHSLTELDPDEAPTPEDVWAHWERRNVYLDKAAVLDAEEIERQLALCRIEMSSEVTADTPLTTSTAINVECARQFATLLRPFDLVVVDESHNVRKRGKNIKTNVLTTLLGLRAPGLDDGESPDAEPRREQMPRLLMLTATPAYYSERDIYNQFAYRDRDALAGLAHRAGRDSAREWVEQRTIRRLRRLSDKTKYDYRRERALETLREDPSEEPEALVQELMLALVQKRLAHAYTHRSDLTATIKVGYLETFESFENPDEARRYLADDDPAFDEVDDRDSEADDTDILRDIAARYQERHDDLPPHPKLSHIAQAYEAMLSERVPEKLLVFVRRCASVREISRRMCQVYDKITLRELKGIYGELDAVDSVRDFQRHVHHSLANDPGEVAELVALSNQKSDDLVAFSSMLAPFKSSVTTESGSKKTSGGFGFRMKFNKNQTLEDFFSENQLRLLHDLVRRREGVPVQFRSFVRGYVPNAQLRAVESLLEHDDVPQSMDRRAVVDAGLLDAIRANSEAPADIRRLAGPLRDQIISVHGDDSEFDAVYSDITRITSPVDDDSVSVPDIVQARHFWDHARGSARRLGASVSRAGETQSLLAHALLPELDEPGDLSNRLRRRMAWLEMISKQLRMSGAVIDLFFAFVEAKVGHNEIDRERMAESLAKRVFEGPEVRFQRLRHRIWQSNLLFDHLVKHLELKNGGLGNRWAKFNDQEPALGVMGGTGSRERAIAQFNSPFFPDVIVSTSVLREGVDLHLSCRRVWHYGLPASPGSLEQQTGRVDRYFARVHRALDRAKSRLPDDAWASYGPGDDGEQEETLEVGFPYVPRSIDETQLKRLLHRKGRIQPVMDRGLTVADTEETVELDSWDERAPSDILEAFSMDASDGADPLPADPGKLRPAGHQCTPIGKPAARQALAKRLDGILEVVSDALGDKQIELAWRKQDLDSLHEDEPLMLLNTYIVRREGTLSMFATSREGARHQPTLVHLRYLPNAGLYVLEFDTPLSEGKQYESVLRETLMREHPESGCSVVASEHRASVGAWQTRLIASIPLDLSDDHAAADHLNGARVIGRMQTLMKVADKLENKVLEGDIKLDDVRSAAGV